MLVAAGKAQPGATVLLQNGGQTLGETKADENGDWVLMLERPLPAGPYDLSILSVDPKTQERVPGRKSYALTIAPQDKKAQVQTAAAAGLAAAKSAAAAAQQQARKGSGGGGRKTRRHALGHSGALLRQGHGHALRRNRERE